MNKKDLNQLFTAATDEMAANDGIGEDALSVCLSVCLSVTVKHSKKTVRIQQNTVTYCKKCGGIQ